MSVSFYSLFPEAVPSINYIGGHLDVSYIGRQVYGELIYQIRIWFLHYTIRFALSQNLELSTLVHKGHHILDPSEDLHPSDQRRDPSYHNLTTSVMHDNSHLKY